MVEHERRHALAPGRRVDAHLEAHRLAVHGHGHETSFLGGGVAHGEERQERNKTGDGAHGS